jgi:hypothetical protein
LIDFDALGERAEMIAAVASAIGPHTLARPSWQTFPQGAAMRGKLQ